MAKEKRKSEIHSRTKYIDHSRRFLEWVNNLGFEQTFLGKLIYRLDLRFRIRRILALMLFSVFLSFLIFWDIDFPFFVQVGDIATSDIKSPISFQIVDEIATEAKRQEAEQSVPPVFDYDPDVYENISRNIYRSWRHMRLLMKGSEWPKSEVKQVDFENNFFKNKKTFEEELGYSLSDSLFQWLVIKKFSARLENILLEAIAKWSTFRIIDESNNLLPLPESPLIIRLVDRGSGGEEYTSIRNELKALRIRKNFNLFGVPDEQNLSPKDRKNLLSLSHSLLVPNLTFNRQETAIRKLKARNAVLPVQISIA
ncbi:MAG: hypothetical protein KDD35_13115, partial [Bdellovibrionales bacterium]|nr:hypothetical protein [Bdellovibrionales bacterium]